MANICGRCKEEPAKHRGVSLRISEDIEAGREAKLRKGPLDLCQGCFDDLISRATLAWEQFRPPTDAGQTEAEAAPTEDWTE